MLTRNAVDYVRSRNFILDKAFSNAEQFLNSAILYPDGQDSGRILFVPLKSEEEFEEAVYSTAIACLTRSYEVTHGKRDTFEEECNVFAAEILHLCKSFPAPIVEGGKQYIITAVSTGARVPIVQIRELDAVPERVIRYELLTQGHSFLRSRFQESSDALNSQLDNLREIERKWKEFKLKFRDIELLQKTTGKQAEAKAPSLAAIAELKEAGLNSGVLVFTGKTSFKNCFKALTIQKMASDIVGVAEVVHKKPGDQALNRVQGRSVSHPLIILHEPNDYFASWVRELRGVTCSSGNTLSGLGYLDTVVLDVCAVSFDSEEEARMQISAIKDQLALGEIRTLLCLVRTSALNTLPALISRWKRTGRSDVPVQVWHLSRQQAAALSDLPVPKQFDHSILQLTDNSFEEQQQTFRTLIDRLRDIVQDLPGAGLIGLLTSFRELYFRFISFCDPASFQHDASAYLIRLESLARHVGDFVYNKIYLETRRLLEQIFAFLRQKTHPLIAAARKHLFEAKTGVKKSSRLGVLSYNTNTTDQEYLTRYLTRFAAPGNTKPVRIDFFDAWNLPPAIGSQPATLKILLCFNLPKAFITSLFFNRFAHSCMVLCDQTTAKAYFKSYHTVKAICDQFVSDTGLSMVLNLPASDNSSYTDTAPCFEYGIPLSSAHPEIKAPEPEQFTEVADDDIETIISRLIQAQHGPIREGFQKPRESGRAAIFTLLLDQDGVLEAAASRRFYRIEEDNPEDKETLSVSVSELKPGDYVVLFKRSNRENLNILIDESLAKVDLYADALKKSDLWRDSIRRINKAKRQHLQLNEVFQRVGFERAPQTFDNYLEGNTTKPLHLEELLLAINAVSKQMPGNAIPFFMPADINSIIEAVDRLSRIRRMLPKALRAAVINRRSGRLNMLGDVYGEISPELLETILHEVDIRRIREVIPVFN